MLIPSCILNRAKLFAKILKDNFNLDVYNKRRFQENVTARIIVAYQLRKEGIPESMVAQIMGKHHCTIRHYVEKMENILNLPGFKAEREVWNGFKKKLDEYDSVQDCQI